MQILYEEGGEIRVATILTDQDTSLMIEAPHGKRSKLKANAVLMRFDGLRLQDFFDQAAPLKDELDADFLWECAGTEEVFFLDLAREYYGHAPSPVEAAAIALKLHASPMHFYKKGRGHYKPADAANLTAAKASEARKRLQAEQIAGWVADLSRHELPPEIKAVAWRLLTQPDKNSLEYKALEQACAVTHQKAPHLLLACGAFATPHAYHLRRFLEEYFPAGREFADLPAFAEMPPLPQAEVAAFSIDDAGTTEIDDAFSVTPLTAGFLLGIHIAAPGLLPRGSSWDSVAQARLSTVYMPGDKITMLPDPLVDLFTLQEGRSCPALSLYADIGADFSVSNLRTVLEEVPIAANLRIETLEPVFNEGTVHGGGEDFPYRTELLQLFALAEHLKNQRGKNDGTNFRDYHFDIDGDHVVISERQRGSPIDTLVSELMIFANASWGAQLANARAPGLFRTQKNGKTKMSVEAGGHQGLGVEYYAWATSPLRRYADLVNQRQLMALAAGSALPYPPEDEEIAAIMRDFEMTYDAYAAFQRLMERYWSLRYIQQENLARLKASVIRENLVRFETLPLVARAELLPELPAGTLVWVEVTAMDLFEAEFGCRFVAPVGD